jgi:hypothetical protein
MGNADASESADDAMPLATLVDLDFSAPGACASVSLDGDAACDAPGGYVELNPDVGNRQGAMYLAPALAFGPSTRLHVHVVLEFVKVSGNPPGDGAVIVVQADPRGANALGGGADMGFDGIVPSIGVELDTFDDGEPIQDPDANHSAIDRDGVVDTPVGGNGNVYSIPFPMTNGGPFHVWLDYDATQPLLAVSFAVSNAKPPQPSLMASESLTFLGSAALVGFVGGTAFAIESHRVLAVDVRYSP